MIAEDILFDAYNPYAIQLTDKEISNIQTNSRLIEDGDLFVAIKGHTVDGHQFIEQAIQQGAHFVLADKTFLKTADSKSFLHKKILFVENTYAYLSTLMNRFLDSPSQKMNIFGITGQMENKYRPHFDANFIKTGQNSCPRHYWIRTDNYSAPMNNTTPVL